MKKLLLTVVLLSITVVPSFALQQSQEQDVTIDDYERAEQFLGKNTSAKVYNRVMGQSWSSGDILIYNTRTPEGKIYYKVNPQTGKKEKAFDHQRLAESLAEVTSQEIESEKLRLRSVTLTDGGKKLRYRLFGKRYETNLSDYKTKKLAEKKKRNEVLSPDGKKAAYIKDHNLWVRNTETGEHTQLTTKGEEYYGYATNNAGWVKNESPVLLWGPNSEKIATFRHDSRDVGEMYLYNSKVGHSKLKKWKYPLPGDSTVFKIERVIVHLGENPEVVKLDMDPDYHRSTISDHIASWGGRFLDNEWINDGKQLAFVSSSRNHQVAQLRVADAQTGKVRDVLREEVDTYFESGYSTESWTVLDDTDEVIWFSERDNWGHLYLYDLNTGELEHQITKGNWRVLDLQHIDEEERTVYFTGSNRAKGNPYYHYLYKINMDGSDLQKLTPQQKHHRINWSKSKDYFTDSYSTPERPPVTVVRNRDGEKVMTLEKADISELKDSGWVAPEQFKVKARDGETDLYGLMYKPSNFDSDKSYPVLNYLYPGPQSGSVGSRSFMPSRSDKQAVAELGFIVVEVDAMGTPGRSKSFHDAYYGDMGDNGLPDQIATIRQLADRHSWMDTTQVGIWGHSGGGFASTRAILEYPDFYKVAVSGAGNHDNRNYEADWGEKWHGLLKEKKGLNKKELERFAQGDNYDKQANQLLAENLEGELLIAHGLMDDNVPPTNTLLVAEALIRANKDFDMLMIPNVGHGFGYARNYFMNKRWDYFVKHLKGVIPPTYVIGKND
ncbi:Dipeptidyl aminopeptidase/acylaminoacyl peptidase [Fodinibius salinus]|uniref:Dipeptidyl aminopeptidase/acylaminoacyl peptidase n=1 Tax=Fodinibius salinus TaxID=860790 RepID=A0A5D3YFK7_9BACT|nr:DPP IV N-terminal domain-containing protein [Fodinibius salinus]TYP92206.1 Dipeptidyl aminopeptidase/acylaminoacyl peptidase [Fodinibius salinus]